MPKDNLKCIFFQYESTFLNNVIKYGAKVLGQLSDSHKSYIASVTIVQKAG